VGNLHRSKSVRHNRRGIKIIPTHNQRSGQAQHIFQRILALPERPGPGSWSAEIASYRDVRDGLEETVASRVFEEGLVGGGCCESDEGGPAYAGRVG